MTWGTAGRRGGREGREEERIANKREAEEAERGSLTRDNRFMISERAAEQKPTLNKYRKTLKLEFKWDGDGDGER